MKTRPERLLVVGLAAVIAGCGPAGQLSSPSLPAATDTSAPSLTCTATPFRDRGSGAILDAGTYVVDYFPGCLTFDIPAPQPDGSGWHAAKSNPYAVIVLWYDGGDISYGFAIWNVDNLYVDPCYAGAGRLEPPVGPSVDDLVTALSTQPGFEATAPVDVTVGAFQGKRIELTALDSVGCADAQPWSVGPEMTDMAPGEVRRLDIVDVDGVRLVFDLIEPEQPDPAIQPQFESIFDSMRTDATP